MNARTIAALCGTALALTTATAVAQSDTNRNNNQDTARQTQRGTTGAVRAENILQRLEGTWRVELDVDRSYIPSSTTNTRDVRNTGRTGDAERNTQDPANQNRDQNRDTQNRDSQNRDSQNRDNNRTGRDRNDDGNLNATDNTMGQSRLTGYARTKMILGGSILQEKILLTRGSTSTSATSGKDRDTEIDAWDAHTPSGRSGMTDQDRDTRGATANFRAEMEGMAYFSFNEPSQTYNAVFMNSQGSMKHCTGEYDATLNRVVFQGSPERATTTSGRDANRPAEDRVRPGGSDTQRTEPGNMAQDFNPDRVVLEVLSPDQFRVTMYPSASPSSTDRRDSRATSTSGQPIYRATYTRVSQAEGGLDSMFDDQPNRMDRGNQRNIDRNNPNRDMDDNRDPNRRDSTDRNNTDRANPDQNRNNPGRDNR